MNKAFSKLDAGKRKIAVIFFSIIGGSLSLCYICEAIIGVKKENEIVTIKSFEIPKQINPREEETHSDVFLDEDTWNRVQSFKHNMDSLKKKNDPAYYKIMNDRPGLMDSIQTLEQIYYSQKIK